MKQINWIAALQQASSLENMQKSGITTIRIGIEGCSVRSARLFSKAEAEDILNRCQQAGLRREIVFNRLWMEEELPEMEAWLQQIQIWNPEGIVYMDPAVFLAAEKLGFQDRLIYAPDTLMTNSRDLQMMLDLGVGRVVLAAEITLEEILEIARKTDGSRLELQIHGRQVMAYSRRPLVSNYLQVIGKSVDDLRHRRDLYLIEATRTGKMPVLEEAEGAAVYMESTLCSLDQLSQLAASGIRHFAFDSLFSCDDELIDARKAYGAVLEGADPAELKKQLEQRWPDLNYGSGYYEQKTNLTQEDAA